MKAGKQMKMLFFLMEWHDLNIRLSLETWIFILAQPEFV
jgi:hypothetical protein